MQKTIKDFESEMKTLNSLLRMAIAQKVQLTQRIEELEMERERQSFQPVREVFYSNILQTKVFAGQPRPWGRRQRRRTRPRKSRRRPRRAAWSAAASKGCRQCSVRCAAHDAHASYEYANADAASCTSQVWYFIR